MIWEWVHWPQENQDSHFKWIYLAQARYYRFEERWRNYFSVFYTLMNSWDFYKTIILKPRIQKKVCHLSVFLSINVLLFPKEKIFTWLESPSPPSPGVFQCSRLMFIKCRLRLHRWCLRRSAAGLRYIFWRLRITAVSTASTHPIWRRFVAVKNMLTFDAAASKLLRNPHS